MLQDLIKTRRTEPWRVELRRILSNRDRMSLPAQSMRELHQEPSIASLYTEGKLGFSHEEALAEARRCLDCPNPGCMAACPAQIHIPTFIKCLEADHMLEAWKVLRERSTLSAICSRVCAHDQQCEGGCIYGSSLGKSPVRIGALERYVASWEQKHRTEIGAQVTPERATGHRVAIIGAGPSGLAAAHDLSLRGHSVTVIDRLDRPGGVMLMGIPRFRLPYEIIEDEVARLESYGVSFEYGLEIGQDIQIEDLFAQGYEAIYLGTGACVSNVMGIEGEDLPGVYRAGEYLIIPNMLSAQEAERELESAQGKRVAIIGGGNTAMDAARTARRLGASQVTVVYRRSVEEMPACRDEVEHALSEGIEFKTLHQVKAYHPGQDGRVAGMTLIEMQLTEPDESGRRRPEPTGRECEMEIDEVVICVGVSPDDNLPKSIPGLECRWGSVIVVDDQQRTNVRGIYAGGDACRGGATVVHAMRDGREAAYAIHRYLLSL